MTLLRRRYSSFADGWPGAGLLFLRLVAGLALIVSTMTAFRAGAPPAALVSDVLSLVGGLLLLLGLWTPIAGSLVAMAGVWNAAAGRGDLLVDVLLGTMGAALVLLGPGTCSVDARLFGWKRIEIRNLHR